jgi:toxin-antitoxin system PIN domain toxin
MSDPSAWLLDVNVLVALLDPGHIHHEAAHRWWAEQAGKPWATCTVTESGLVRVLTQPRYPNRVESAGAAVLLLSRWKNTHRSTHRWWPIDVSLTDATLFAPEKLTGSGQVTDACLLGLAQRRGGRLASFDRALPWEAVVNGSRKLIELLS